MLKVFILQSRLGAEKEMVAEIAFHHQREDFPPHPDDPSSGKIEGIVSFLGDNIKGVRPNSGN